MRQRILFVDDEKNFLEGIRLMLRGERKLWDMDFAEGAQAALQFTKEKEYDCIISDVSMPIMTGLDLLEILRQDNRTVNTPVVILTGNAEADLKRRALDLGATDLLNKPVTQEDLLARIRSVLVLKGYQDELKNYSATLEDKVRERTRDLERARRDIILRLAKAGEMRDEETGQHVVRVACFSRALSVAMNLHPDTVETIFFTSPLHDIGKIGVPDSILLKNGKLLNEERAIIEKHCEIGANILLEEPKGLNAFLELSGLSTIGSEVAMGGELQSIAAEIALSHHEKWDGTGYPRKLKEESIPISARIVAVADVYDALRSQRPYKPAYSHEQTLEIMTPMRALHFAPDVFDTFIRIQDEFLYIKDKYSD
jgi:putative two-component system response regulator